MLVGVIFFAKPGFLFGTGDYEDGVGIGIACIGFGSFLGSCAHNIVRKLGKNVHFTVSITYFSVMGILLSSVIMIMNGGPTFPERIVN